MSSSPPLVGPEVALSPADEKMVELAAEATAETFAPIFRQFVAQLRRSASPGPRPRPPARPPAAFFSPEGGGLTRSPGAARRARRRRHLSLRLRRGTPIFPPFVPQPRASNPTSSPRRRPT